jgi:hypothetical protein
LDKPEDLADMSRTTQLSDESAQLLKRQAEAHGLSIDAWVEKLAREKADLEEAPLDRRRGQAAAARILEIQTRVKPDPDGWTIRNYIDHGRP